MALTDTGVEVLFSLEDVISNIKIIQYYCRLVQVQQFCFNLDESAMSLKGRAFLFWSRWLVCAGSVVIFPALLFALVSSGSYMASADSQSPAWASTQHAGVCPWKNENVNLTAIQDVTILAISLWFVWYWIRTGSDPEWCCGSDPSCFCFQSTYTRLPVHITSIEVI